MAKLLKFVGISIMALLCIAAMGATVVMADFVGPVHPVQVELTGVMQLGWFVQTDSITVAANFTANVPLNITAGTYNATFQGFARVSENYIDFNGVIETENGTFMAEFEVPNTYTVPMGECGASGILTLQISDITTTPPQFEYVQLVGNVRNFGNASAFGWLGADAKISTNSSTGQTENVADARAAWEPISPSIMPLWSVLPNATGNFTYSFYAARLINTTMVALNYSGYDVYIAGLWTVLNVTFTYSGEHWVNFTESETSVAQNVTGELMVNGNWGINGPSASLCRTAMGNFTLSLAGFDDVTGSVEQFVLHARAILDGDVLGHGTVDIYDLVYIARYIGSTPGAPQLGGLQSFEGVEKADLNGDFHVDIYDLVTAASQIGQTD
jgi:hypothetical protein